MLIEEERNYAIIGSELTQGRILYERLYNTIHNANLPIITGITTELKRNNFEAEYGFDKEKVREGLQNNIEVLVLNLTELCNLSCDYCIFSGKYLSERSHSSSKMSLDIAKAAIDIYKKHSSKTKDKFILFYGGEPLIEEDLIKSIAEYARANFEGKINFGATTNFTLARKNLDYFAENEFLMSVSLDGPKIIHDQHRKYINGQGSHQKIIENLEELLIKHPDYYKRFITFSVTLSEPGLIKDVYSFFQNERFKDNLIRIQGIEEKFVIGEHQNKSRINIGKEEYWNLAREYIGNIVTKGENNNFLRGLFDLLLVNIHHRGNGLHPTKNTPRGTCIPGKRKLFVSSNGEFYMCEKVGRRAKLGDIKQGINSESCISTLEEYIQIKNDLCKNCWASRLCDSCPVSAKDVTSISKEGQKLSCRNHKERVINGVDLYARAIMTDKEKLIDYLSKIELGGNKNGL